MRYFVIMSLGVFCIAASLPAGTLFVSNGSQFQSALNSAQPGDEIVLNPGTYSGYYSRYGLTGVTIRSADPENRAILDANGSAECMHLSDAVDVTLQDLIMQNASSNGLNIDDGGSYSTPANNVVLRNLLVRGTSSSGNNDAIKLSGLDNFTIEQCRIEGWGGSAIDMVGCHDGLIQNSHFECTPTTMGATGVRPKGGSGDIVIRANRFVNASTRPISIGGSTGLQYFRPQPPGTVEAYNVIAEGNVVEGGEAPVVYINTDDGIVVRNNLIYRPDNWVIRILKENTTSGFVNTQDGEFRNNVVIWNQGDLAAFVNVGPNTNPGTFQFEGNWWYNQTNPSNSTPSLPASEVGGVYGVDPGVDINDVVAWDFDWGHWLVNANETPNSWFTAEAGSLVRAIPGEGADFDIEAADPLLGEWTYELLSGPFVSMDAYSQELILEISAIANPGDTDVDGDVDAVDLANLGLNWDPAGTNLAWAQGDFNGDGDVDAVDLAQLGTNWSPAAAVPEPATLMCLLGGLAVGIRRK